MTTFQKLRGIYLLANLGFLLALWVGSMREWAAAFAVYFCFQVVGVGLGVHRYSAHKSFETNAPIRFLMLLVATLSTVGCPMAWAGLHRIHHLTSDSVADPHSPHFKPIVDIIMGRYMRNTKIPIRHIRDLAKDPIQVFFYDFYFRVLAAYVVVLGLIDWHWILFGYLVPVALVYWVTATGIVLNHTWGYRNFQTNDLSVNSWPLSLLTIGDGWHNNHHHDPTNPSHSRRWWEFDLCFLLIRILRRTSK